MKKPSISVVLPSYNHGRHVSACIDAFLSQTLQDFELIIIDDASVDDNLARIKEYSDGRIKLIERRKNHGVAAGMNDGFRAASADIVCFFATDHVPDPGYLDSAVAALAGRSEAVAAYFPLRKIAEDGTPIDSQDCRLPWGLSRLEILRASFMGANQLPSPGMVIRRDAALRSLLPDGVCQYSDWMFNNRLLLLGDIVLAESPMLSYRVSASSLSAHSLRSMAREMLETRIMMDDFLTIKDPEFLAELFPAEIGPYANLPACHIPFVLGRLALLSEHADKRCWGYELILRHLSEPGMAESLRDRANFTYKNLMALVPTETASLGEQIRQLRRRNRHLRRWCVFLAGSLALASWLLLR
jgi:GT2 family glycosyltransferase